MRGDGNVRFCSQCSKHVYDLSALTQTEAEALLVRHEGRLCAQVFLRVDGTILTSDCWVGRTRTTVVALCAAASAAALALGAVAYDAASSFSMSADGPCDVARETAGNGVMLPLSTHAPQSAAVCANPPPDRTRTGHVYATRGFMAR